MNQVIVRKQELRHEISALRAGIPPEEKREADRALTRLIMSLPAFLSARTVFLYASVGSEIGTGEIAEQAFLLGKSVAFPRTDTKLHRITFHTVTGKDKLIPGVWSIPEPPASAPEVIPDRKTFCLVPGYSFDRNGYRVGYGGGYYDRFLAGTGNVCRTVGAVYERFFVDSLPRDGLDVPVSLIVTEKGVYSVD